MGRRLRLAAAIALFAGVVGLPSQASVDPACAGPTTGGDWPLYGHDLANSRTGTDTGIGPATVGKIAPAWVVNVATLGGAGDINSTPTVSDGCTFVATDAGDVYALNADTGAVVWHHTYPAQQTRLGGVITGAVSVDGSLAFIAVSDAGRPYIVAVNKFSGVEAWRRVVDTSPGEFMNASPVPFNGMLFVGLAGDEYNPPARGGYAILRESDGAELAKGYTIPNAAYGNGYWGGSIWSTAAVDAARGYAYVGAGNPDSHTKEYRTTNAVLKIDVNPARPTFGTIVDVYKGATDQYYAGLDRQPVCSAEPDITYGDAWSATCVQLDLDFGASPTLFTDANGDQVVAAQQKAGIVHGIFADTMEQAWTALVGTPCAICNASSPASDGGSVFAVGTQPGQAVAMDGATGGYHWVEPLADAIHYNSVSIANGVVYTIDFYGDLNAFDEVSGLPLLKHNLAQDAGTNVNATSSAGVSIARHTLYVPAAGFLVAYR